MSERHVLATNLYSLLRLNSTIAKGEAGGHPGFCTPKVKTDIKMLKVKFHISVVLHKFLLNSLYVFLISPFFQIIFVYVLYFLQSQGDTCLHYTFSYLGCFVILLLIVGVLLVIQRFGIK